MTKQVDVHEQHPPDDRLGRIAGRLLEAFENDPEHGEERAVVVLTEPATGGDCMTAASGYEEGDTAEPALDLFAHMRAMLLGAGMEDLRFERRGGLAKIIEGVSPETPPTGAVVTITITDRKDGITALIESKPPMPTIDGDPDYESLTGAQACAIYVMMEIGKHGGEFEWTTVHKSG